MVDDKQVQHIATLARLNITAEEREQLKAELSDILNHCQKLDLLDTEHVEPMQHVIETHNVLRSDETCAGLTQAQALQNAPQHDGQFFVVPAVFES